MAKFAFFSRPPREAIPTRIPSPRSSERKKTNFIHLRRSYTDMSTPHLDPFLHYPKTTALGLGIIGLAGTLFIAATLAPSPSEATFASDAAGILIIVGMWIFFVVGAVIERRKKYAALLILIFGLFLLCLTTTLPFLIRDLLTSFASR